MKQVNGWGRPATRGTGRGRRHHSPSFNNKFSNNGVPSHGSRGSYRGRYQKHYNKAAFFEAINERMQFTFANLAGKKVEIKQSNGMILEGTLLASSMQSSAGKQCTLKFVSVKHRPEHLSNIQLPEGNNPVHINWSDLIYIHCTDVDESSTAPSVQKKERLKLDAEIARKKVQSGKSAGRELTPPDAGWLNSGDSNGLGSLSGTLDAESTVSKSGQKWDQFKANEEQFGVKNTYDESLYTSKLDRNALSQSQIRHAEKTAREIESSLKQNPKNMPEQDEEARFAAVARPKLRNPAVTAALNAKAVPQITSSDRQSKPNPERDSAGSSGSKSQPLSFAAALMKGKKNVVAEKVELKESVISGEISASSNSSDGNQTPKKGSKTENVSSGVPSSAGLRVDVNCSKDGQDAASAMKAGNAVGANLSSNSTTTPVSKSKVGRALGSGGMTSGRKVPNSAKYKVSDVNLVEAYRKFKTVSKKTPTVEDNIVQQRKEANKSKSREQQIQEFKQFSSRLESSTLKPKSQNPIASSSNMKSRNKLNVNAKEFKPPEIKPLPIPPQAVPPGPAVAVKPSGPSVAGNVPPSSANNRNARTVPGKRSGPINPRAKPDQTTASRKPSGQSTGSGQTNSAGSAAAGSQSSGSGSKSGNQTHGTPSVSRQSSNNNISVHAMPPQNFVPQPGVFPMHMQQMPGYPMMHPIMVGHQPQGMQGMQGVPNMQPVPGMMQNPQMMFQMPGQPYLVQMVPQQMSGQMQPTPQMMQAQHFGQPRIVYNQMPPGMIPMQAQMPPGQEHAQMQQAMQLQQQQQQQQQTQAQQQTQGRG